MGQHASHVWSQGHIDPGNTFPKWFRDLFVKNQDKKDKMAVISLVVEQSWHYVYPDSEKSLFIRHWSRPFLNENGAHRILENGQHTYKKQ